MDDTTTAGRLSRRSVLRGAGLAVAAGAAGSAGSLALTGPAGAAGPLLKPLPMPKPIDGGVPDPQLDFLHVLIPGPTDAVSPILGLPGFGLDTDPSTIGDFQGFTAFAILSGQVEGSDGNVYDAEVDVRGFRGEYIAEDGSRRQGAFAFL